MFQSCFLFGHADAPQDILLRLEQKIENEVSKGISIFYVGYHGNFDHMAASALRAVKRRHSQITLMLLLAYHPAEQPIEPPQGFDGTFYPPLGSTPRKFAIVKANRYMIQTVDSIICYMWHSGSSRELLHYALKRAMRGEIPIHNLAEDKEIG